MSSTNNVLAMYSTTKFVMIVLTLWSMGVSINIVEGFPRIHDNDCLNIEMRPVPRFGKRFDSGKLKKIKFKIQIFQLNYIF